MILVTTGYIVYDVENNPKFIIQLVGFTNLQLYICLVSSFRFRNSFVSVIILE
jgi:hypothetical protein